MMLQKARPLELGSTLSERESLDRFEQTGAQTAAGRYLRRFWHPVFVGRELTAGRTALVQIMGEEFVLYRSESGAPHLLDARCAHRKVLLSIGKVEQNCLRCRYHGWKYDSDGQCVEQPAESKGFAQKVKLGSYPVREYLGLIWAYIGREQQAPPPPRWPLLERDDLKFRFATSEFRPYNFFADLENLIDDSHLGFVHARSVYHDSDLVQQSSRLSAVETEYGLLHETQFSNGHVKQYLLLMPNCVYFKSSASSLRGLDGLIWTVPVDDRSHKIFYSLTAVESVSPVALLRAAAGRRLRRLLPRVFDGRRWRRDEIAAVVTGKTRFEDMPADALLEDHVVLAAQGTSTDRSSHWLGTSDVALILLRKLWTRELDALTEGRPLTQFAFPEGLRPL